MKRETWAKRIARQPKDNLPPMPDHFDLDGSESLAHAQARAAETDLPMGGQEYRTYTEVERRCIFHHSVPANQGFRQVMPCENCGGLPCLEGCALPRRRCLFGHSVPANQGFEIKAGFCCFAHSGEFDSAGS